MPACYPTRCANRRPGQRRHPVATQAVTSGGNLMLSGRLLKRLPLRALTVCKLAYGSRNLRFHHLPAHQGEGIVAFSFHPVSGEIPFLVGVSAYLEKDDTIDVR